MLINFMSGSFLVGTLLEGEAARPIALRDEPSTDLIDLDILIRTEESEPILDDRHFRIWIGSLRGELEWLLDDQ